MVTDSKRPKASIEFGRVKVVRERRELFSNEKPVFLSGRLFDLLIALIDSRGRVLGKSELINLVWAGRVVEENSLAVAISTLRRALGTDGTAIRTVSGRGYQFLGEIREADVSAMRSVRAVTNLPAPTSSLIGRDTALAEVCELVKSHRLATLTGAGGIGKTRLGIEAARTLQPHFVDGVWMVDLAPLNDPGLLATRVGLAVGFTSPDTTHEGVAKYLADLQVLVLLDNCEHMIDAAAQLASQLGRLAPRVSLVCTSREPLRVEGEWVYHVEPLEVPEEDAVSDADIMSTGAAELFITRTRAAQPRFAVTAGVVRHIASLCRRLDGLPLAIELAAARAAILGVEMVFSRLNERFRLLTGGSRTALLRHQTLRATLDWSYELLDESERRMFCRLGIFAGEFTLDAATTVLSDDQSSSHEVTSVITQLVQKSMISSVVAPEFARYRMLESTRAYALEQLSQFEELTRYARLHANFVREIFRRAFKEWVEQGRKSWSRDYTRLLDDARAALDWALGDGDEPLMGAELTVVLAPLWISLSLGTEWAGRVRQALAAIARCPDDTTRLEMQLRCALGNAIFSGGGRAVALEGEAACAKSLEIAELLGDTDYQMMALFGLFSASCHPDRLQDETLALAERFARLADKSCNPRFQRTGDVLKASSHFVLGDLSASDACFMASQTRKIDEGRFLPLTSFDSNPLGIQIYILWLRGLPDQSDRSAAKLLQQVVATGHALSISFSVGVVLLPFFLMKGDLVMAASALELLEAQQRKVQSPRFQVWISNISAAVQVANGDRKDSLMALRERVEAGATENYFCDGQLKSLLAQALGDSGEPQQGLRTIDGAIQQAKTTSLVWFLPEYLRCRGDLLAMTASSDEIIAAERCYLDALDIARQQGALAWELRAATSLARLRCRDGRTVEGRRLLGTICERFTEGFDTPDFQRAYALLNGAAQGAKS